MIEKKLFFKIIIDDIIHDYIMLLVKVELMLFKVGAVVVWNQEEREDSGEQLHRLDGKER